MLIKCYVKGAVAGVRGDTIDANPHPRWSQEHGDWLVGHEAGVVAEARRLAAFFAKRASPAETSSESDPNA